MGGSHKVLLVGGAGFIGAHTAKALINRGAEPTIFDSFSQYIPTLSNGDHRSIALKTRFKGLEDVPVIRGNAAYYREVRNALERSEPGVVVHLGGLPLANVSNDYVEESIMGIQSTGAIIQAMYDIAKFKKQENTRFIYISSSTVYGDFQQVPASEDHPKNPKGVYAGVKLAGEELTRALCKQFKIPFIIVRPQAVYGPTDINERVVQKFIEGAIRGEEIEVRDPTICADFTYIEDIAEGLASAATVSNDVMNETFNISRGEGRTLGELLSIIQNHFSNVRVKIGRADDSLPRRGSLDISKAKRLLNFDPKYSLDDGVEKYIQYYKKVWNL